jgi:hypothetical protein
MDKASPHKDWYNSQDAFLKLLMRWLPDGARCLQIAAGVNSLASMVRDSGRVHSLLNIDIVPRNVEIMLQRFSGLSATALESTTLVGFQIADAFNLNFSDFERTGWQRFDVVFEKAGMFDVHKTCPGCMQRLLACIVTEAFEPSRGGTIIALVRNSVIQEEDQSCIDPGLASAVAVRPDFNCMVTETVPLEQSWFKPHDGVAVLKVECGGVTAKQAKAGCDLVFIP